MKFDATNVDTTNTFDSLPAGDYVVMITDSQEKRTKSGDGEYLELTLEVQSGDFRGRRIWDRLNLENPNPKAVQIAQRQLSQLCHAVGVLQVREWQQLHNRQLVAIVRVREGMNGPMNEVKGYKGMAGPAHAAQPTAPRAAAAAPTQPWKRAAAAA